MSTKIAPWAKWPSKWLKSLPNPLEDPREIPVSPFGTGIPLKGAEEDSSASQGPQATVSRFQDYVERPLRSTPPTRQEKKGRGRSKREADGSGADPDRGGLDGALGGSAGAGPDHADGSACAQQGSGSILGDGIESGSGRR